MATPPRPETGETPPDLAVDTVTGSTPAEVVAIDPLTDVDPAKDTSSDGIESPAAGGIAGRFTRAIKNIRRLQFRAIRWVLFKWIRPTFLGADRNNLSLSDDDLVCYVLPYRSTADLMVTDQACLKNNLPAAVGGMPLIDEERSFFFLGRPEGRLGRKSQRAQSERMNRLFSHYQATSRSIKIVPVSIFWGHQPDREKSIFKLLLSENWSATSRMKKFLAMLFHRRHILVQFGQPVNLAELIDSEEDQARQVRKLMRLLRVHFTSQRQAIIGPDLSHRRTLLNTILESDEVSGAIRREANKTGDNEAKVQKRALSYAQEIASDQSYRVIRFFDVLLTWLWNNLYGGIEVNNVEIVKHMAQSHEIVYIPCHRSHIDYLLLSYVLYHNGLTPPHIAAGKNLNLPIIGPLLRRAGAFFMRRSFQGDALYKEVFDEYLHQMFTKGYSVEYFIEGGRSRTGRTLPPRTGMLRMTVQSFQRDATMPIAFMPVYFGYERVLESSTYRAELAGKDKKSESMFDVFKIFPSFKRDFGQVTVNFGEPIILNDFLDTHLPDWRAPDVVTGGQLGEACLVLADELVKKINHAVAVTPTSLVAVALLSTAKQNIEERYLIDQVERLRVIALRCGEAALSVTDTPAEDILEQVIRIIGLTRQQHQFGTIISASQEQSINLTYNANNVVHVFALPSLAARFIRARYRTTVAELRTYLTALYPYLEAEMFLPWSVGELDKLTDTTVACLAELEVIIHNGEELTIPPTESTAYKCLQDIAGITDPTLERFYIVMALLQHATDPSTRKLEISSAGVAEQLSVLYGINSPDFFDKSLFATFLSALKQQHIIDSELNRADGFAALESITASTLDPDVRYNILQAVSKVRA